MAVTAVDVGRFRHLALFYHGRGDYLAALARLHSDKPSAR